MNQGKGKENGNFEADYNLPDSIKNTSVRTRLISMSYGGSRTYAAPVYEDEEEYTASQN